MNRGVVAAPGIIKPLPEGFVVERSISKEELRYYMLYWDEVVIPGNNLVYIAVPEEEELIASQVIARPIVQFQGTYHGKQVGDAVLACQAIVAKELVQRKVGDWVLHQIGDSVIIPPESVLQKNTIRVDLINALPVPDGEVPIQDVLTFKQNRKDELMELHDSIDELYFEILGSPDQVLARKKAVQRFQSAILNVDRTLQERFRKTLKYDFSAELNLNVKDIVAGFMAGTVFDFFNNPHSIPIATIVGALAAMIKLSAKASKTFEPAKKNMKLSYVSNASKQHIIKRR
ncbi:MAG: hypothetical protein A4E63_00236 [Syntrophorhabdus sp. PtaU1.Bin050]|jgi:hypothetical protein|nr:MAG: hypothetical protein A4E63_00236 [Syntrophorhabdus sp. PtaU1.Bin050]